MNPILAFGEAPPQKNIPHKLSAEEMLLFAAWSHGMKIGCIVHRFTLFAYVQSHIANKFQEPLQSIIENKKYWHGQGKGFYALNHAGEQKIASQFDTLPEKADLEAKYLFTRKFKQKVFQTTVNPVTRQLLSEVDGQSLNGVEACQLLVDMGAIFYSPSTNSKPAKLLNWIIQDNDYHWQRLVSPSPIIHRISENYQIIPHSNISQDTEIPQQKTGQSYQASSEIRQALEAKSMDIASAYFKELGWTVTDVSKNHSYDLHCKIESKELRVEVKGTTTDGASVLLTPNEVTHAQEHYPNVALFVVSNFKIAENKDNSIVVSGGTVKLFQPWQLTLTDLTPTGYSYIVPKEIK